MRVEFQYMADFMLKGYQDPKRGALYGELMHRLRCLGYDVSVKEDLRDNQYLAGTLKYMLAKDTSAEALQTQLLSTGDDAKAHLEALNTAFYALLASYHWRLAQMEEWLAFLTSQHTSEIDAATLVTAISLSTLQHFSLRKTLCLAYIYKLCENDVLRQRAFVGCVLSLFTVMPSKYEAKAVMEVLFQCPTAAKDIMEVMMQILTCANAVSDSKEINQNLMPDILKNQPFKVTRNGIVEREEENDIIDIHADERRMDAMEESIKKMVGMQKKGSDIFFSGFSQMKRLPFYNKLVNWFVPFTMQHPDIAREVAGLGRSEFVERVTKIGPFCDSDKYSFVIAISSVISQLPDNVKKMMESGEVGPLGMPMDGEANKDVSFIRLRYLQDLYRFYSLHTLGKMFFNPFAHAEEFVLWNDAAPFLSDADVREMCLYLIRKGKGKGYGCLTELVAQFKDKTSFDALFCMAEYQTLEENYPDAIGNYQECLRIQSNHPASMRGIARAYFANGDYAHAAFYFDALHTLFPNRNSYFLNYAMAMVKDGMVEDVLNDLYKLEYEHPDDISVKKTLAWALLYAKKPEQSLKLFEACGDKNRAIEDIVNHSYALLFCGKIAEAVALLSDYAKSLADKDRTSFPDTLLSMMQEDHDLLALHDFHEAEIAIIVAQV